MEYASPPHPGPEDTLGQFAAIWLKPVPQLLGACLFLYDTQFWKARPEPNYTATDFVINSGGTSQWPLPASDFQVKLLMGGARSSSSVALS